MNSNLDDIRKSALESVDAADRRVRRLIGLAAVVEAGLLATFLAVMDLDARLHWLLLISALLVYATLSVGLLALGGYIRVSTLRVLKALEISRGPDA